MLRKDIIDPEGVTGCFENHPGLLVQRGRESLPSFERIGEPEAPSFLARPQFASHTVALVDVKTDVPQSLSLHKPELSVQAKLNEAVTYSWSSPHLSGAQG